MSSKSGARHAGDISGVLLLDKPKGTTSNHVLQRVRRLFGGAKAGHTGTLDPLASGLLPLCLGEATKFSQSLLDSEKSYQAHVRLGWRSRTGDSEGELTVVSRPLFSDMQLDASVKKLTGEISQIPPMYSALKRDGKPLYKLARQGLTVERAPRIVVIRKLCVLSHVEDLLIIDVTCSKGTYIRVLAENLGEELGCGAYLQELRRTAVAGFGLDRSITLERLEATAFDERPNLLLPVDTMVASLPMIELGRVEAERMCQGQASSVASATLETGAVRLYGPMEAFIGIGEIREDGLVHPKRLVSPAFMQTVSP